MFTFSPAVFLEIVEKRQYSLFFSLLPGNWPPETGEQGIGFREQGFIGANMPRNSFSAHRLRKCRAISDPGKAAS
jgi:hypothetical protein